MLIKIAEKNDKEGEKVYKNLKEEFTEKYLYKNYSEEQKDNHFDFPLSMGKMS